MIGVLLLDGFILILLGVMIGYAVVLNRRLRLLRDSRGEMDSVVDRLTDAVGHADRSLAGLREMAEGSARHLQERSDSGRVLLDELNFVVERAEAAANRLDASISGARGLNATGGHPGGNVVELAREPAREQPAETPRRAAAPKASAPASATRAATAPASAPRAATRAAPGAGPGAAPGAAPGKSDPARPDWASLEKELPPSLIAGLPLRGETRSASKGSAGRAGGARAGQATEATDEAAPSSRGAALVRALRGMR